jgi:hypothetical protein
LDIYIENYNSFYACLAAQVIAAYYSNIQYSVVFQFRQIGYVRVWSSSTTHLLFFAHVLTTFIIEEIDAFKAYVAHSLLASHPLYFFTGSRGTFEVKSEEELASIRVIEEGMKSQKLARKAFVEKLRMRLNILDGKISEQKIEFNKA